ncbi:MAG: caspase family protein [Acidobacteria bacterium]|nr:caspase family protein [Acidobacteriota bacterium]
MPEQPAGAVDAAYGGGAEREPGSFGELDEASLGEETLVAYAAAAGTTAADGDGRNSPYTTALLAHLEQQLELSAVFRRVRVQVLEATDGEQRPHEYAPEAGERDDEVVDSRR